MPFSRVDQRALSGIRFSQCDGSRTGERNLHNGRPVEGLPAALIIRTKGDLPSEVLMLKVTDPGAGESRR